MKHTKREIEEAAGQVNRRALILSAGMVGIVAILGARMRYLQVDQANQFLLLAEENRVNIRLLAPERGLIHDRLGRLLAGNKQSYRVIITREDAGNVEETLTRLTHLLPLRPFDVERMLKEIKRRRSFVPVTILDQLEWGDLAKISVNAPALPGISVEVGLSRSYPLAEDFAHIIGYVGPVSERDLTKITDPDPVLQIPKFQIGKIGVERWSENILRGQAGSKRIEVNALGRVMRELERTESMPGADIRLTIDAALQNFTQARLVDKSAAAVVIDVTNGDILAISSAPSFDPNFFVDGISQVNYNILTQDEHRPLANKAVQGAYPPGSTFKMVTALAALDAGVIRPEDKIFCPGYYELGGRRFHCWQHGGHGTVNLTDALEKSCDVFFYEVAQKVGIDKIAKVGHRLGLGQRHELTMSSISNGVMPDKDWKKAKYQQEWRVGDTINASIGQGYVLTTPLQLAVMTARLSTGKNIVPRLIMRVNEGPQREPEKSDLGFQLHHIKAMRKGMFDAVNSERGTARGSRIQDPAMKMAGKTGTSQVRNISAAEHESGVIANEDLPWLSRDHSLFVGFAPYDDPKVAVSVVVEHGGGGSAVAAPIARDILLSALTQGVPPLSAYPPSQRDGMEEFFKNMKLRHFEKDSRSRSKA
jgi:penicillin-binding protein 2